MPPGGTTARLPESIGHPIKAPDAINVTPRGNVICVNLAQVWQAPASIVTHGKRQAHTHVLYSGVRRRGIPSPIAVKWDGSKWQQMASARVPSLFDVLVSCAVNRNAY